MTREVEKTGDTGFNWVVYGEMSMAKETVGLRVPVAVAEQVDRYAETHDMTRTAVIDLFIRTGLDEPDGFADKRTYAARIPEDVVERVTTGVTSGNNSVTERIVREIGRAKPYEGEYEEDEALTARLPGEVVRGIEEWAESQDMAKSNAAADLLVRGLRQNPYPDDFSIVSEGRMYTFELEPEEAELFRKYRLTNGTGPSKAAEHLLRASTGTGSVRPDWGKPDEQES
jgi:hypothetical protein